MTKKSKFTAVLAAILIAVLTACGVSAEESTAATMQAVIAAAVSQDEGIAADAYTMQDVSALCDMLLTRPPQKDLSEKHYDLNGDGVWNAADRSLMKQKLLEQHNMKPEFDFELTEADMQQMAALHSGTRYENW